MQADVNWEFSTSKQEKDWLNLYKTFLPYLELLKRLFLIILKMNISLHQLLRNIRKGQGRTFSYPWTMIYHRFLFANAQALLKNLLHLLAFPPQQGNIYILWVLSFHSPFTFMSPFCQYPHNNSLQTLLITATQDCATLCGTALLTTYLLCCIIRWLHEILPICYHDSPDILGRLP